MHAEFITAALVLAPTALVPRQRGPSCPVTITCPANNGCWATADNGAIFQLRCRTDFNGPIISISQVASFDGCVEACSAVSGCRGINYRDRFCYLLGTNIGSSVPVSNVNAATQTRSATARPSPTPGSSTCTTAITCPANDGCRYVSNRRTFFTRCAFDFYGGDMPSGSSRVASLRLCVDRCASTTGCVAVSYNTSNSRCYLKSNLRPAVYSSNTNGAYLAGQTVL